MIIRLLLKIWPALLPIIIYCLWLLTRAIIKNIIARNAQKKSGKIIEASYQECNSNNTQSQEKVGDFSFSNKNFIIILYISFFIAIICFLFFAIRVPKIDNGRYVPAHIENGKITKGSIVAE